MVKHARLATEFFPDFSGHTLDDGRYKLISLIGSGSYGKVYKAIDVTLPQDNQYVAIKCLEQPPPGSRQELFQTREFASHSKVGSHTNIVTFRGFFFAGEFVFVVLDLCDGGDLFTLLEKKPTFFRNSDHRVRNTMVQLIDAVEHCHKLDVFHRDLKPENILIAQDGHLYLADFGLCTNSPVSVDFGCGSSFYMSPECIGKEYKHSRFSTSHADIWALGIILANLLTQRNPWRHAMTTDSCFSAFLRDEDFFRMDMPVSEAANTIFRGIFTINPLARTSLPELRRQIISADTFFKTEQESLRLLRAPRRKPSFLRPKKKISIPIPAVDSEESFLYPSPLDRLMPDRESMTLSSKDSSAGLATPPTKAVDLVIEVSELPDDVQISHRLRDRFSGSICMPGVRLTTVKGVEKEQQDTPEPKRSQFLRRAAQRLMMISGSRAS